MKFCMVKTISKVEKTLSFGPTAHLVLLLTLQHYDPQ